MRLKLTALLQQGVLAALDAVRCYKLVPCRCLHYITLVLYKKWIFFAHVGLPTVCLQMRKFSPVDKPGKSEYVIRGYLGCDSACDYLLTLCCY